MKAIFGRRALLAGVSAAVLLTSAATRAYAQDVAGEASPGDQDAAEAAPQDIVVTGSRISRPDYSSASPIVSVRGDALAKTGGSTLDSVLGQLPQFTPSRGATSGGATQGGAGQGQVTANIRGLGPQRTLVLLDGRRLAPSNPDGTIDLSTVPETLIGSIEVITGGASATYGSDAVSGVLNFKLRRDLEGLQLDAKTGITEMGDAGTRDITASWGAKFAEDRGRVLFSLGFHDRDLVRAVSREFFRQSNGNFIPPTTYYANDAGNPYNLATLAGRFASYGTPLANPAQIGTVSGLLGLNEDGSLYSIFNLGLLGSPHGFANYRGAITPDAAFDRSGLLNVNYSQSRTLQSELKRYNAFGRVEYDLSSDITAYAQILYAENNVRSGLDPVFTGQTFGVFVPFATAAEKARVQAAAPDLYALMITRPNPDQAFSIYKGFTDQTIGRREGRTDYVVRQFLAGLQGKIPGTDMTWEFYGSSSKTRATDQVEGASLSAIQSLLANPAQCSGYNIFSGSTQPQDCLNFIRRTATNHTSIKQDIVEGTVQGGLFELPAGTLRFALGGDYRRNSYDYRPDALFQRSQTSSPQGPRNPPTSDFVGNLGSPPASGSTDVTEIYGELLVPLLKDTPFIEELNLGLGARYSKYDTVGSVWTYKADLDWRIGAGFRLRGGYNRAVRAPSVGELFKAESGGFTGIGDPRNGQGDPCSLSGRYRTGADATRVRALCIATGMPLAAVDTYNYNYPVAVSRSLPNPDLKEETADTFSVGAVWASRATSPLLSRLSLSVDYYSIRIKDAVGTVPGNISLAKCFNAGGDNPNFEASNFYCQLILRDPGTGVPVQISIPTLNLATYKTSGVDVQLDWGVDLDAIGLGANAGSVRVNAVVNYLDSFKIQSLPGAATLDYAGTIGDAQIDPFGISKPEWKGTVTVQYANGPFDLSVRWRYIDGMRDASRLTGSTAPGVKAVNYTDLNIGWKINDDYRLSLGVDNLFDRGIPTWTGFGTTDPVTYDVLGRRFYASVRANF